MHQTTIALLPFLRAGAHHGVHSEVEMTLLYYEMAFLLVLLGEGVHSVVID
jgi:hypothetical protein